eukprot:TRINITY_DN19080_c0_g1_i2.p1 TRINITY_DN19080_c0_g1~~TRINITY_DN19080_c0_g1_i2.p1  ORF type:complete len:555 (+),score=147.71 TRINITY_DN19080_c0_g1_i2:44-1666(+)
MAGNDKEGFLSRQVNIAADTTLQIEVSIFVTGFESEDTEDLVLYENPSFRIFLITKDKSVSYKVFDLSETNDVENGAWKRYRYSMKSNSEIDDLTVKFIAQSGQGDRSVIAWDDVKLEYVEPGKVDENKDEKEQTTENVAEVNNTNQTGTEEVKTTNSYTQENKMDNSSTEINKLANLESMNKTETPAMNDEPNTENEVTLNGTEQNITTENTRQPRNLEVTNIIHLANSTIEAKSENNATVNSTSNTTTQSGRPESEEQDPAYKTTFSFENSTIQPSTINTVEKENVTMMSSSTIQDNPGVTKTTSLFQLITNSIQSINERNRTRTQIPFNITNKTGHLNDTKENMKPNITVAHEDESNNDGLENATDSGQHQATVKHQATIKHIDPMNLNQNQTNIEENTTIEQVVYKNTTQIDNRTKTKETVNSTITTTESNANLENTTEKIMGTETATDADLSTSAYLTEKPSEVSTLPASQQAKKPSLLSPTSHNLTTNTTNNIVSLTIGPNQPLPSNHSIIYRVFTHVFNIVNSSNFNININMP